jgi:hypothetical protein
MAGELYNTGSYDGSTYSTLPNGNYDVGTYDEMTYITTSVVDRQLKSIDRSLFVNRHDTLYHVFELKEPNGTPVNLTNFTLSGIAYHNVESVDVYPLTIHTIDALTGKISIEIPAEEVSTMDKPTYLYNVYAHSPEFRITLRHGTIFVNQGK